MEVGWLRGAGGPTRTSTGSWFMRVSWEGMNWERYLADEREVKRVRDVNGDGWVEDVEKAARFMASSRERWGWIIRRG
jgi:hypothetical protein